VERENELLEQLASRPFDRTLRLVFADWLSERGDPRGEVIALAERGSLSLSERRRLARLIEDNARKWLGPLVELADAASCRFEGGFLSHLACQTPTSAEAWRRLADDVRLATVTSVTLPVGPESPDQGVFLRSPRLKEVKRLQATASAWGLLRAAPQPAFSLLDVAVSSWSVFRQELEVLAAVEAIRGARRLELVTSEFVNPLVVKEITDALLSQKGAWRHLHEVRLLPRFGVVEGAAHWLLGGAVQGWERWWRAGQRWSVEYGETLFSLERPEGRFTSLRIELSQHDELTGLGQRISVAASVLVQLGSAGLTSVEVVVPLGARLRASERDALRAAARRLGTVKVFAIGGVLLPP